MLDYVPTQHRTFESLIVNAGRKGIAGQPARAAIRGIPFTAWPEDLLCEAIKRFDGAYKIHNRLPKSADAVRHYKGPGSDWKDPDTLQGRVYAVMLDGAARTVAEISEITGLTKTQVGSALNNMSKRHKAFRWERCKKSGVVWRVTEAAE
jgi:hypothetical protein